MQIIELPEEVIAEIFGYLTDTITVSRVCLFFNLVARLRTRFINVNLSKQNSETIVATRETLKEFQNLREIILEISYDINIEEKSAFCNFFREKISKLMLREMSCLNPFLTHPSNNLTVLKLENSDLSSCSNELCNFLLSCPLLNDLSIIDCSGLEVESLNLIGQYLNQTSIKRLLLFLTYSYFDISQTVSTEWTIEKLKSFSIKSKFVVMKKNFAKNIIARRNENLKILEFIGKVEVDFDEPLIPKIIQSFPNLEKLSLARGCSVITNEDFCKACNFYRKLKSLEFHFSKSDSQFDLEGLQKNESIETLTIGLTNAITFKNLSMISKCLPNVCRLNIILYYFPLSNKEFMSSILEIFPKIQYLSYQRTGMSEEMKFTAITQETVSSQMRHFDDVKNLTN